MRRPAAARAINSRRAPGLLFLPALSSGLLLLAQSRPIVLPALTTARAAHQLTVEESRRAYPVRLRAVVTFYDAYADPKHPALFVSDSTGSIFVALSAPAIPLKTGQFIEVTGVSGPGDFAPIVDHADARVIAESHLPATAPAVSLTQLLTGKEDGQWVEVEGVVHAVVGSGKNIVLKLALSDGEIAAATVGDDRGNYEPLVDARIRLRGNAAPLYTHKRQMTGWHLLFPGTETVNFEEPAPVRPFASPVIHFDSLLSYSPNSAFRHRVQVRGATTFFWPGRMLCLQDGSQGLCAQTDKISPVRPGEMADVIGFPSVGDFSPTLTDADYKASGGTQPVPPLVVTAAQAFSGDHDAELVEIQGQLLGEELAAADPTIILSAGKFVFRVVGYNHSLARSFLNIGEGSTIKVTGICLVRAAAREDIGRYGFPVPESFRILVGSPADVAVVQKSSWWTAAHTLRVLAAALLIIFLTAGALFLQLQRGVRTALELRRSREITRRALEQMEHQAHHDSLTGLANRLLFEKSLGGALAQAERTGRQVGLLYMDLDRFKIVNDTLGHAAGDWVLRQAAERFTSVSPQHGILARLGGDEFALMLPGIAGRAQAEVTGQRLIDVLSAPFEIDGSPWHCPASVGLSVFPEDALSAAALQRNADAALYRAKRTCSGQVATFDRSMSGEGERDVLIGKA